MSASQDSGMVGNARIAPRAWLLWSALLALYVALLVSTLPRLSVTVDEFGHLPAGFNLLSTGDFNYAALNPPLMNVLNALPLKFMSAQRGMVTDADRYNFWVNGDAFMGVNKANYQSLFNAARCMTILVVACMAWVVFRWAHMLCPTPWNRAGFLACGLLLLCPEIPAHGTLVTTDAGAAAGYVAGAWCLFCFLRKPGWMQTITLGLVLGVAQLVKFTNIYLYPISLVLVAAVAIASAAPVRRRLCVGLVIAWSLSLCTINAAYMFHDVFSSIPAEQLASGPMRALRSLPLPLPRAFVTAFDQQLADTAVDNPSFIWGETFRGSRWFYFFALYAIKTPLSIVIALLCAAVIAIVKRPLRAFDHAALLLPAFAIIAAFSFLSNKQIGLRQVLPAWPLVAIWTGVVLNQVRWTRLARGAALGLFAWLVIDLAAVYPHYLTYFNFFVGGPARGYRYALDSNVDWGQGLIDLKRWYEQHHLRRIQLLYFGRVDPDLYGITYRIPEGMPLPGYFAVSVNLYSRHYGINDHGRARVMQALGMDPRGFGERVAVVANSIHIYKVPVLPPAPK